MSSVVAGLSILGHWVDDGALLAALNGLPDVFGRAVTVDWTPFSARSRIATRSTSWAAARRSRSPKKRR